jgi:serine protease Do
MRIARTLSLLAVLVPSAAAQAASNAAPAPAPGPASGAADAGRQIAVLLQQGFTAVARDVFPSVVTVRTFVRNDASPRKAVDAAAPRWIAPAGTPEYPGFQPLAAGSGFFVDADGDVLTCLHPFQRADGTLADLVDVETQDGSVVISELVGSEPTLDLAIVHCMVFPNWRKPDIKALHFGDSDAVQCGQWALGFGDPPGPEKALGVGVIVARPSRDCYQELLTSAFLQTSLQLPPQAFGGPLVDLDGAVIGILCPLRTATAPPIGGPVTGGPVTGGPVTGGPVFALPSKILASIYPSIRKNRSFQSPWLGFSVMSRSEIAVQKGVQAFNAMKKPRHGILIENLFQPSPAAAAGVQPGDFLTDFDGKGIFAPTDFQRLLYLAGVGRQVNCEFFRDGETFSRVLTIEKRPPEAVTR